MKIAGFRMFKRESKERHVAYSRFDITRILKSESVDLSTHIQRCTSGERKGLKTSDDVERYTRERKNIDFERS